MKRIAFKMQLNPGCAAEYKKRHDEIWPELIKVHEECGILDYTIFHDEETDALFATLKLKDHHDLSGMGDYEIVRNWWENNRSLMVCEPSAKPVISQLTEVFHMD